MATNGADVVTAFLASRRAQRRSEGTIAWYRKHLVGLVASCGGELPSTVEQVEQWIGTASSTAYAAGRMRAARAFYRWAARRKHVDVAFVSAAFGPTLTLEPPLIETPRGGTIPPRTFTAAELVAIFAAAAADGPEMHALVAVLLDTGIRADEAATLTRANVRAEVLQVRGKGGKTRIVPISAAAQRMLLAIGSPAHDARVFHNREGGDYSSKVLQKHVVAVLHAAGLRPPKCGAHTFRHTFATSYLAGGGSLKRLQLVLGHASVTTTEKYLHLIADREMVDEHRRVTPLNAVLAASQLRLAFATDEREVSHG